MIKRVQFVRDVGQFRRADTPIPLGRLTLTYAENGRGKTTLAAVIRSLATGDPIPIMERRRLTAEHPPQVVLDCDGGTPLAIFSDGGWNRTSPNVVVFDDIFVDQNVHSGLAVEAEHRQNLHELVLGTQGVALSRRLQDLVDQIERHNAVLRAKEAAIPEAVRGTLSVDQFCALKPCDDVDGLIEAAERRLVAAHEQDRVRNTAAFEPLSLPAFDIEVIDRILGEDLPSLDAATAARVQLHVAGLGPGGEAWIAEGMQRLPQPAPSARTATCPFCAQDLAGSHVINHYRTYFSAAYRELKDRVSGTLAEVNRTHDASVLAGFERAIRVTVERQQFWSRLCRVPELNIDTETVIRDGCVAREAVVSALTAKQHSPLERMTLSHEARAAVAAYDAHRVRIGTLSRALEEANEAIRGVKEQAAAADPQLIANDLSRLRATKARHTPGIAHLCDDYLAEKSAKTQTEQKRRQTRSALDQYRTDVFPNYETAVNLYLQRFNAGFRLDSVTPVQTRGGPTCTYSVVINNTPVPVAGGTPSPGEPSFRNTLSSGDRNTLALAFFFASLDQDPELHEKVVVIDDPLSSLDEHRSLTTVQEIRRLGDRAGQLIVLSHNKQFLCGIWEGTDPSIRVALQVVRNGEGSIIQSWHVQDDCVTEHDRRHAMFRQYLADGTPDKREVAKCLRPLLEAFLRVACPEHFPPETRLGSFCNLCTQRLGTPQEILDSRTIQELRDLIEYSNRFHHDTNPAWETETMNDAELAGFVRRTLDFARP